MRIFLLQQEKIAEELLIIQELRLDVLEYYNNLKKIDKKYSASGGKGYKNFL